MTIWDILGIEPTTDKKIIKRAYAARSKVIHPEEKPEEFQMLYRAYQAALLQAKNAERGGSIKELTAEAEKEEPEKELVPEEGKGENAGKDELLYYFEEQNRLEEEKPWEILNPDRRKWESDLAYQELQEKNRRAMVKWDRLEKWIRRGFYIVVAGFLFFIIWSFIMKDLHYIVEAMPKKYPEVEFSKPKWTEFTTGYYHFTSSTRSDIEITAFVTYWVHNGGRRILIEDYGVQVLGGYAEQYGLKAGMAKGISQWDLVYENSGILYYPAGDLEEVAEFCRKAYQMFQEQEELQELGAVGFCMEGALYEEMILTGGKKMTMVSEPQFFKPWEMTEEELTQKVQEAYIEYRFNYEPWKLTLQEYRELGPAYEKICGRLGEKDEWYELYVSGEWICGLYIRNLPHSDYSRGYEMSVGNVYYYLRQQGAHISVSEDGAGFGALNVAVSEEENGEEWVYFGEEPYLEVDELKELLPAFDWKEESVLDFEIYEQQEIE